MWVLLSIPLGVTAQLALFLILTRGLRLAAKPAALVVALAAVASYMPYALLRWPGGDVLAMHIAVYLVTAYALGLIMGHRETHQGGGFHWAPGLIVAFFVVLVLFNAVLVVLATRGLPDSVAHWLLPAPAAQRGLSSAFPGVVENDFQKKEALYNSYLEQVAAQQARGWQVQKGWLGPHRAGQPSQFQLRVQDRAGQPVTGAEIVGGFLRPSDTRLDQWVKLDEVEPGLYRVELVLPVPGAWDVSLEIRQGEALHVLRARTQIDP